MKDTGPQNWISCLLDPTEFTFTFTQLTRGTVKERGFEVTELPVFRPPAHHHHKSIEVKAINKF